MGTSQGGHTCRVIDIIGTKQHLVLLSSHHLIPVCTESDQGNQFGLQLKQFENNQLMLLMKMING